MLLKTKSKLDFIGYVIATLWALYSHHFALFVLIVQGLWFAYEFFFGKRDAAKRMFKAFIAIGVGYTPWLLPLYNQIKMVGEGFWLGTPDLQDLIGLITEYLAAGIRNTNLKIFGYHLHEASTLLVVVALFLRKWQKDIKKTLFLLSWFLGPILLTWIVSQKFQSIFFNRYLLYAIPGAMLTLASMGRKYSGIFIGILLLLFLRIDYHYFTHPTKLPFREMSAWVKETLRQDSGQAQKTVLINWNAGSHHLWETKYYGIPAPIYVPGGGELPFFVGTALMEEGDIINEIPENTRRVGVVTSSSIEEIDLPGYTEEERKEMDGLKFVWYLKE